MHASDGHLRRGGRCVNWGSSDLILTRSKHNGLAKRHLASSLSKRPGFYRNHHRTQRDHCLSASKVLVTTCVPVCIFHLGAFASTLCVIAWRVYEERSVRDLACGCVRMIGLTEARTERNQGGSDCVKGTLTPAATSR